MKKIISLLVLLSLNACAASSDPISNENPIEFVKSYNSGIACEINEDSYQYLKATIDHDEYMFVYWEGDIGCNLGSGTMAGHLTVARKAHFAGYYVMPNIGQINLEMLCVDFIEGKGDLIRLNGISYGKNDHQRSPSLKTQHILQFQPSKNKFVSVEKVYNPDAQIGNECVSRVR